MALTPQYNKSYVLTGLAAIYLAPFDPVNIVQMAPDSSPLGAQWPSPWVPIGATMDGVHVDFTRAAHDIRIEEQATQVDQQTASITVAITTTLSEDTLETMRLAYGGGAINVTAPTGATTSMAPPVMSAIVAATAGGAFAAGTYFWKVTALNSNGETLPSNEVTQTMTVGQQQVLTWAAVTGATGYKVYRGTTTNVETTLVVSLGLVLTYTDTGTFVSTMSAPVANTTASAGTPGKKTLVISTAIQHFVLGLESQAPPRVSGTTQPPWRRILIPDITSVAKVATAYRRANEQRVYPATFTALCPPEAIQIVEYNADHT